MKGAAPTRAACDVVAAVHVGQEALHLDAEHPSRRAYVWARAR
jgi:hypothetical protein